MRQPVRGRLAAGEQAGPGQDERAGADRGGPGARLVRREQPVAERAGAHLAGLAGAAGDEDDVRVRDVGEGGFGLQGERAGLVADAAGPFGHEE
jgi:hypothetical protein